MKNYFLVLPIFLLSHFSINAQQTVNAYAKVTNIVGTTLDISTVNESFDSFEDGEEIILYQVQDTVVNDTSNAFSFGNITNIQAAGFFEVLTILSHTEVAGIPTSITVSNPLSIPYNPSGSGSLQLISFPELGLPNFTTTGNISGMPWDGNVGGVVAFQVANNLILDHSIDASNLGFRGGRVTRNVSGPRDCITNNQFYKSSSNEFGEKGEGIYKIPANNRFTHARGHIANGGGGGTHHNGGGGGGSNQTAGGEGGFGYNATVSGCPATASCGGLGGANLSAFIRPNRFFLGGGGGGGQQNNSAGSDGRRGGGFIFIKADSIILNNCTNTVSIAANGQTADDGRNDGMGGGGAGGSILLDINGIQTNIVGCQLNVTTNGGNGGNAVTGTAHSGGGGGGQGAIRILAPTSNAILASSNSGLGGCNNSACDPNNLAASGQDSSSIILLSAVLEQFNLTYEATYQQTVLDWQILPFNRSLEFIVQRSVDAISWEYLDRVSYENHRQFYEYIDPMPLQGHSYYRIQYDTPEPETSYTPIKALYITPSDNIAQLAPNPTSNTITLRCQEQSINFLHLYNIAGVLLTAAVPLNYNTNKTVATLQLERLPAGIYILHTNVGLFKIHKI
ncbi:MAG: T9SS type A sorting domain-containing protein [Aureispira sp.]